MGHYGRSGLGKNPHIKRLTGRIDGYSERAQIRCHYIVISEDGGAHSPDVGDNVIAFALQRGSNG